MAIFRRKYVCLSSIASTFPAGSLFAGPVFGLPRCVCTNQNQGPTLDLLCRRAAAGLIWIIYVGEFILGRRVAAGRVAAAGARQARPVRFQRMNLGRAANRMACHSKNAGKIPSREMAREAFAE
jgi:hypothetical protein